MGFTISLYIYMSEREREREREREKLLAKILDDWFYVILNLFLNWLGKKTIIVHLIFVPLNFFRVRKWSRRERSIKTGGW